MYALCLCAEKWYKMVENAGTDTLGRTLSPTGGVTMGLPTFSSGPRALQDAALLQKRGNVKGNSIKNIFALALHEASAPGLPVRTLQGCASLLNHAPIFLWIWHHTKRNSRLSSLDYGASSVESQADCVCALTLYLFISSLFWSLDLQSPLLVWFDLLMCHKPVFVVWMLRAWVQFQRSTVRYSHFSR